MDRNTKIRNETVAAQIRTTLREAKSARALHFHRKVDLVGNRVSSQVGDYFENFACTISNRIIDIFDDCVLLIKHRRIPSACVIARGVIETYAFAKYARHRILDAFSSDGLDGAGSEILKFTNSSFFKTKSQEEFKAGILDGGGYHFTEEAILRMQNETAGSIAVSQATRFLFDGEMNVTGRKESKFEIIYSGLCEWTHPSQTSLLLNYAKDTQLVETSFGLVHIHDHALLLVANSLHFITDLQAALDDMSQIANFLRAQK